MNEYVGSCHKRDNPRQVLQIYLPGIVSAVTCVNVTLMEKHISHTLYQLLTLNIILELQLVYIAMTNFQQKWVIMIQQQRNL